jgi:hypothetical protein
MQLRVIQGGKSDELDQTLEEKIALFHKINMLYRMPEKQRDRVLRGEDKKDLYFKVLEMANELLLSAPTFLLLIS